MTQYAVVPREADGQLAMAPENMLNPDAPSEKPLFDFILIPVKKDRAHGREAEPSTPWTGGIVPTVISGQLNMIKQVSQEEVVFNPNHQQHRRLMAVMVADAVGYEDMGTQPMKNLPSLRSVYRIGASK